jgi:hypothetical protein
MAWSFSFSVSGANFHPGLVSFAFTEEEEVGSIAQSGAFKGKPRKSGSALYRVPIHIPHSERLKHLADVFEPLLPTLRDAGATKWEVWVVRYYHSQCNEEFAPEELKQLTRLDCPLCYSAYAVSEEEEAQRRKEFGYE